jgi:hypothetical protein
MLAGWKILDIQENSLTKELSNEEEEEPCTESITDLNLAAVRLTTVTSDQVSL